MLKNRVFLTVLLPLLLSAAPLGAVTLKLGSPFPEGTEWDRTLRRISREWKEITGGRVNLRIYPGGIAGSEEDMVRKMRIGQLDAAVMTLVGLNKIVSDSLVFSLPFLIRSEAELDFVMGELTPLFDEEFKEKGFEVLLWSKSGWINLFSREEIYRPDDLRRSKMGVSPGEQEMIEAFKALEFKVVPLSLKDTLIGLQSGMIDTVYTAPMGAAAYQWFGLAPYMNPIDVMPVVGGVVLSERAWKKIPASYHEALREAVKRAERDFYQEAVTLNRQAMELMRRNGLVELEVSDEDLRAWLDLFREGHWMIAGEGMPVSQAVYDEAKRLLKEFREEP